VIFDEALETECERKNAEETGLTRVIPLSMKGELAIETTVAPHPYGAVPERDHPRICKNKG
jgi:hypothetical protein